MLPPGTRSPLGTSPRDPAPVGFAIVKESWSPVEVPLAEVPRLPAGPDTLREIPENYLIEGERAFRTEARQALFILLKVDPATPGTDDGWIHGTVTADGAKVTSAGRVESCMACHTKASRDRLFGMHLEEKEQ